MRRLIRSRLIWIYTVCKCVSEFTWCPNLSDFILIDSFVLLIDMPEVEDFTCALICADFSSKSYVFDAHRMHRENKILENISEFTLYT